MLNVKTALFVKKYSLHILKSLTDIGFHEQTAHFLLLGLE